ncbi:vWA domain-containing protein [Jannaschia pohangensis]|uniref:VWFA domain-containing protein n=1 Tax=Jannaschia pohangensis TaxID=390807 RepID=A0A1I3HA30_9RHOB|nr:VWA domain-containing protein [Jannaschia pohangensis]SFI32479.1 hypothetical protein SAMN04488095_0509 [Jannaschia pohangensis]
MTVPRPLLPYLHFAAALRAHGFPAASEQTVDVIAATELLGPRALADIRAAARALYGPPPERWPEFDALFDQSFLGRTIAAPAMGDPEDMPDAYDAGTPELQPEAEEEDPSGSEATVAERLFARDFDALSEAQTLRRFARSAPAAMPMRRTRRTESHTKGPRPDPARAFRDMARRDGDIGHLPVRRRVVKPRRVLLLIDVSGSMKAQTDSALRIAHAVTQALPHVETFTLGTRLTRVTRALRPREQGLALSRVAGLVADWDGGTRLGDTLQVFLSVPRFASFARGAYCVILSDGLERGDPQALTDAVARLSRLSWGALWLSPLVQAGQTPETAAMQAIAPLIDHIGDGSSAARICAEILGFARGAPA